MVSFRLTTESLEKESELPTETETLHKLLDEYDIRTRPNVQGIYKSKLLPFAKYRTQTLKRVCFVRVTFSYAIRPFLAFKSF